jgi:hypothetical protein
VLRSSRKLLAGACAIRVGLVALVVSLVAAEIAHATPATVALDDANPTLVNSGDGWTTSLGFTNLTDQPILVAVSQGGGSGCSVLLGSSPAQPSVQLAPVRHSEVKVTATSGCVKAMRTLAFTVSAGAIAFPITATTKVAAPPNWNELWAFGVSLVLLTVLAAVLWRFWRKGGERFWEPMLYLSDTWSFKDSWVSNITVGGSLLTGVLGSSTVVKAFLGEGADAAVALATVGAAIAVAMVGAGGLVLLAAKTRAGKFTVGGVLLAAAITLSGATGELWTVYRSGRKLPLGDLSSGLPFIAGAALLLLLVYAARSLLTLLDQGTTRPPPNDLLAPPMSEAIFAASMIVAALEFGDDTDRTEAAIRKLRTANVETALKTEPGVAAPQIDQVMMELEAVKPDLDLSEAMLGIRNVVYGRASRISTGQAEETLRRFDPGGVSTAIGSLVDVHDAIDEPRAMKAVGEILSDQPIEGAPVVDVTRPRAAML